MRNSISAILSGVSLMAVATPAFAQSAPANGNAATEDKDIVVTGTLIRGVAPAGANVIGVSSKAIEESGAASIAQVLQTIPQLASFGSLQQPLANSNEVAVNRPNLRSLPGFTTSGGSSTLVMMDGHRIVGVGVTSTGPDPDVIAPGVLQRIEIVPDGGSAIYGSDAVAGVMNFITIKRFDGVKVDASYGFADNYFQYDGSVTAGKDWGSGSLFFSYNYAKTDDILGRDRSYVREFPGTTNGLTTLSCGAGNVEQAGSTLVVGLPDVRAVGGVRPAPVQGCDTSDYATVYPKSERHSVFGGLTQQLDDTLAFELRGFYTSRKTQIQNGPFRTSVLASPFPQFVDPSAVSSPFSSNPAYNLAFAQNVYFQTGANDASRGDVSVSTWEISPSFTKELGSTFRLRFNVNYGESITSLISTRLNDKGLKSAITGGLINPYNLSDPTTTNSAATLALLSNWETYGRTGQTQFNTRAIVDGDIFTMPGGAVKLAVGAEYTEETFRARIGQAVPGFENSGSPIQSIAGRPIIFDGPASFGVPVAASITNIAPLPLYNLSRNVKSLFGEVVVPLFGRDNATAGLHELTLSLAGRYDYYNDFGGTTNPRIGLTYKPVEWISVHGAWGKSFNAPSLADDSKASLNTLFILSGNAARFFAPPAALQAGNPYPNYPASNNNIVALRGNSPNIKPQTAKTWTLGIDIKPPVVPGLSLSATYYNIDFRGFIGLPPFESPATLYRDYGSVITIINGNASAANQTLLNNAFAAANVIDNGTTTAPLASSTYAYFDARKQNVGDVKVDGIDFSLNYRADTGFGALFLNANGTYTLGSKLRVTGGANYVELINANNSRLRVRTTVGADVGALTAHLTWNHRQGYTVDPIVGFVPQSRVGSFNTFDASFRYAPKGAGIFDGLVLSLNVDNLFDKAPPEFRGGSQVLGNQGYANGATLGRLVQFGISKKF